MTLNSRSRQAIALAAVIALATTLVAAQAEFTIYRFPKGGGRGFGLFSSLTADAAGNLYGTTGAGGTGPCTWLVGKVAGCGTVFRLTPPPTAGGAWTETVLYNFQGGSDGSNPWGGVIFDAAGNLYGTTQNGGDGGGGGTVFALARPSTTNGTWTLTSLYGFESPIDCRESTPSGNLFFDKAGSLYGITGALKVGFDCGSGTVFQLAPPTTQGGAWREATISYLDSPSGSLVADESGNLYVSAGSGGGVGACYQNGCGAILQLVPPATSGGAWATNSIYAFSGLSDGGGPANVIFDAQGNLYGTTFQGGDNALCGFGIEGGCGTVFELTPPATTGGPWTETVLYNFQGDLDGQLPQAGVIFDETGNLYGTTFEGGTGFCKGTGFFSCGTVFKLTPAGGSWTEEVVHSFKGGDGTFPVTSLTLGKNNSLYGTASSGGEKCPAFESPLHTCGTVFEIVP